MARSSSFRFFLAVSCLLGAPIAACSPGGHAGHAAVPAEDSASAAADTSGSGPALGLELAGTPAAGAPVSFALQLTDLTGAPIGPDALAVTHEHKVHVMIVDEALEDYTHTHPQAGPDGRFQVTFTPKFARPYRVWADYRLAGGEAIAATAHTEDHGDHGAHGGGSGAGEHDHGGGSGAGGVAIRVSQALPIGVEALPPLASGDALTVSADGMTYVMSADGPIKAGENVRLRIKVTGPDGGAFAALEPIMGAFAHLVGFNPGATKMAHAHPNGAAPEDAASRGGPALDFDLRFEQTGPHRLFLQTVADGRERGIAFTVNVQ